MIGIYHTVKETSRYMRKELYVFMLLFICLLMPVVTSAQSEPADNFYQDIQGHQSEAEIVDWAEKGLISGYPDGTFRPDEPITRAEFIALVNRTFGYLKSSQLEFSDVKKDVWYTDAIAIGVGTHYIGGYPDGTMQPSAKITRQEVASMLCRIYKLRLQEDTSFINALRDVSSIPQWSQSAINLVLAERLMWSDADDTFKPLKLVTRAEMVEILYHAAGQRYDCAGVYGSDEEIIQVKGNLTVTVPDVTLRNVSLEGNIYLTEGIGDGTVTLENVTVKGTTLISGGGLHSIIMYNFNGETVKVEIPDQGSVRLNIQGDTSVNHFYMNSNGIFEESEMTGDGIPTIFIPAEASEITLEGDFSTLIVEGSETTVYAHNSQVETVHMMETAVNSVVYLAENSHVNQANIDAKGARIVGLGSITSAQINAEDVSIEIRPNYTHVKEGIAANIGNREVAGGTTVINQKSDGHHEHHAPVVTSYCPLDEADRVSKRTQLTLTFDQRVYGVAGKNITIRNAINDTVVEVIAADSDQVNCNGLKAVITPHSLQYDTDYCIEVEAGAFINADNDSFAGICDKTNWNFSTIMAALEVVNCLPVDDGDAVAVNSDLVITFNQNVSVVNGKTVTIYKAQDNSIVETIAVNDAKVSVNGKVVTINSATDLANDTDYYILIDEGAFINADEVAYAGMADATTWNFNTIMTPPILSSYTPLDDTEKVSPDTNLVLTFSQDITGVAGKDIVIKRASTGQSIERIAADEDKVKINDKIVTIQLGSLQYDEDYYVVIEAGAFENADGIACAGLVDNSAWNFSTIMAVPEVSSLVPADNGEGIAIDTYLRLNFNQNITAISGKNIVIKKKNDNSIVETIAVDSAGVTVNDKVVSIDLSNDLDINTTYYVQIDSGAFRNADAVDFVGITDDTTWTFKTVGVANVVTQITASDVSDYRDGRDLQVAFNKVDYETGISEYRIIITKTDQTLDLATANAIPLARYTKVDKTGSDFCLMLADDALDSDGDAIGRGIYKVYILSVADGTHAISNALSTPANVQLVEALDVWTKRAESDGSILKSVCYGNGMFIAVGDNGSIMHSTDGLNWVSVEGQTSHFTSVAYLNGAFYITGESGIILRTTDGSTFTQQSLGQMSYLYDLCYGNNVLVGVGDSGNVLTSINGETWSVGNVGSIKLLHSIVYANNLFVTVGEDGVIFTSPDGINWSVQASGTVSTLTDICYGNNKYVTVGDNGTILTSPDAINWTVQSSEAQKVLNGITYNNRSFVMVGHAGEIYTSSDAVNWDTRPAGINTLLHNVTYGEDYYVTVSDSGSVYTATVTPIAPELNAVTPADNAQRVALDTDLTLTFDETVTAVRGKQLVIKKVSDNSIAEAIDCDGPSVSIIDTIVTIDPVSDFDNDCMYYLEIDEGAFCNLDGTPCAGISNATSWNFETIMAAPSVVSYTPVSQSTDIVPDANLVLTFNQNVSAVSGNQVAIKKSVDDSVVEAINVDGAQVQISDVTVTITPTVLDDNTDYYIQIDANAFENDDEVAFSGIADKTTWQFITAVAADSVANLLATDSSADGEGFPTRITFDKATNEDTISYYRVIVVKAGQTLTLQAAGALPATSYIELAKTGTNLETTLTEATIDCDGEVLTKGSYNVYILSVADGVQASINSLSQAVSVRFGGPFDAWTGSYIGNGGSTIHGMSYGNDTYVAVGGDMSDFSNIKSIILKSSDAVNWSTISENYQNVLYDVVFANGVFVAVGDNTIITSADGVTWELRYSSTYCEQVRGVAYGKNKFVAVSVSGYAYVSSDNGVTWTKKRPGSYVFKEIIFNGSYFVALDKDGKVVISSDGVSWTRKCSGISEMKGKAYDITYGNGRYLIVGYWGQIASSSNLSSWSVREIDDNNNRITPRTIGFGNNTYIIAGNSTINPHGPIFTSADGVTWTKRYLGCQTGYWPSEIEYLSNTFFITGCSLEEGLIHSTTLE